LVFIVSPNSGLGYKSDDGNSKVMDTFPSAYNMENIRPKMQGIQVLRVEINSKALPIEAIKENL
jgi:hypothetical protein